MEHADRPGRPRLVLDAGVYVSAAISGTGAPAELLDIAVNGRIVLLVSPLLIGELREVLSRDELRRWVSLTESLAFIDAVELLADAVQDPPLQGWARVCRDPDDDYLVALAEAHGATLLVSGDKDLLELSRPGLDVRSPRAAVEAISYQHPWGRALIPADGAAAWASARAAGNIEVLDAAAAFLTALAQPGAAQLLPHVVTPESADAWLRHLPAVQELLREREMASGVDYPREDIAYVKLPPDPGDVVRATGDVLLNDAVIVILWRRAELPDVLGLGGWRVHAVGDYPRPEDLSEL